jgi:hypothetical protein
MRKFIINTTLPFKEWVQDIKEDFETPIQTIIEKSYDWHWLGGTLLRIVFFYLFLKKAEFPIEQALIASFILNSMVWLVKEFAWWTAYTFEKKIPLLQKLRKFKIFQWSKIDYKDWRFSTYGGAPIITGLIYLFTKKND